MLLHGKDRRGRKSTSSTLIPLISAMGGESTLPWRWQTGAAEFGVEEQYVPLDNLGVADEEALRAGCQRAHRLYVRMAARDVAPEVVDVL